MASNPWHYDEARKTYYRVDLARSVYVYQDGSELALAAPPQVIYQGAPQQQSSSSVPSASGHNRLDSGLGIEATDHHSQGYQAPSRLPGSFPSDPDSPSTQSENQTQPGYKAQDWSYQSADTGATSVSAYGQTYPGPSVSPTYQTPYSPDEPETEAPEEPSDAVRLQDVKREIETGHTPQDLAPLNVPPQNHKLLRATGGTAEKLDPNFRVLYPGSRYFKRGFVFRVLWPELCGDRRQNITIATHPRFPDENFFIKVRWFVVVREGNDCSTCLSIQTYRGRGVPQNKVKSHHAIMYTGDYAPHQLPSEFPQSPNERPMGEPIRVIGHNAWDKMDPMSRVNFLKLYTVEHYVKVHPFGYVDPAHEWKLIAQFNSHWRIEGPGPLPPATRTSQYHGAPQYEGYQPQYPPQTPGPTGYAPTPNWAPPWPGQDPPGYGSMPSIPEGTPWQRGQYHPQTQGYVPPNMQPPIVNPYARGEAEGPMPPRLGSYPPPDPHQRPWN